MSTITTPPPHGPSSVLPAVGPALLEDLPGIAGRALHQGPAWLNGLRQSAMDRFREMGLPTLKDEEWRYTNVKPIRETAFRFGGEPGAVTRERLDEIATTLEGAIRVVFVDGVLSPELSDLDGAPEGLTVRAFEQAIEELEGLVRPVLEASVGAARDGFEALAGALMDTGVVVHARRNAKIDRPVLVTYFCTGGEAPLLSTPRTVVIAEEGAEVKVVEDHCGPAGAVYLTNCWTDIETGPNSRVEHYLLERESPEAFHVSTLRARHERDSEMTSHRLILGGRLVRNNVWPILAGENVTSTLNGLYVGSERQHLDNHMRVVHEAPHCGSRQYYRGLMADRSRGVFTGRIYVHQEAQKTDAIQSNDNLLLGEGASVTSKPQLEIYADDVRCTHGSTTGQMSEDALFYLRARGIREEDARLALLFAFAGENLDRFTIDELREKAYAEVEVRLRAALAAG